MLVLIILIKIIFSDKTPISDWIRPLFPGETDFYEEIQIANALGILTVGDLKNKIKNDPTFSAIFLTSNPVRESVINIAITKLDNAGILK